MRPARVLSARAARRNTLVMRSSIEAATPSDSAGSRCTAANAKIQAMPKDRTNLNHLPHGQARLLICALTTRWRPRSACLTVLGSGRGRVLRWAAYPLPERQGQYRCAGDVDEAACQVDQAPAHGRDQETREPVARRGGKCGGGPDGGEHPGANGVRGTALVDAAEPDKGEGVTNGEQQAEQGDESKPGAYANGGDEDTERQDTEHSRRGLIVLADDPGRDQRAGQSARSPGNVHDPVADAPGPEMADQRQVSHRDDL